MFIRSSTLPRVGEKMILIGCDGERCETTVVSVPEAPDVFSMFVKDGNGTAFWVNQIERHPCGCVTSHEWSRVIT